MLLKLTSTILFVSPKLSTILFERGCYDKLYQILSAAHLRLEFNNQDVLEISNILFNLATKGHYHFVVEKPLDFDLTHSLEDQIAKIVYADYASFWSYIPIKDHYFLSLLLKCLFEWNAAQPVKNFYLAILDSALGNSLSNAAVCLKVNHLSSLIKYNISILLQGEVIDRFMLYMKVEPDKHNKRRLRELVYAVLRVGVLVSHVKAFMRTFRYNFWESHESYFNSLVSEFARENFINNMKDPINYYHTFMCSLFILRNVLEK